MGIEIGGGYGCEEGNKTHLRPGLLGGVASELLMLLGERKEVHLCSCMRRDGGKDD